MNSNTIETIKTVGFPIFIVLFYLYYMLPKQREREEKRETDYIKMINKFIEDNREGNKNSFNSVSTTLMTLVETIKQNKTLDYNQIEATVKKAISDTISRIHSYISNIITNNNLIHNEDYIMKDIYNFIEDVSMEAKVYLCTMGVNTSCIKQFEALSKSVKEESYNNVREAFTATIHDIRLLEEGIKEIRQRISAATLSEKVNFLIIEREKYDVMNNDYKKLARMITNILDNAKTTLYSKVRDMI